MAASYKRDYAYDEWTMMQMRERATNKYTYGDYTNPTVNDMPVVQEKPRGELTLCSKHLWR